jgi:hypothetical protein
MSTITPMQHTHWLRRCCNARWHSVLQYCGICIGYMCHTITRQSMHSCLSVFMQTVHMHARLGLHLPLDLLSYRCGTHRACVAAVTSLLCCHDTHACAC